MFSRSPVCLCGLVKKVVTCWERHLCFVGFSKTHFQQNGFKRGETAKYLKVTRQSWPVLSRRCICLEMFEECHLHASDCLRHSSQAFSSRPHIFVSQRMWPNPYCILPSTFFFALPVERNAHWKHLCPLLLERVRSYDQEKNNHQTQRKDNYL